MTSQRLNRWTQWRPRQPAQLLIMSGCAERVERIDPGVYPPRHEQREAAQDRARVEARGDGMPAVAKPRRGMGGIGGKQAVQVLQRNIHRNLAM